MLHDGARPRQLHWYHAGPMLFGDWGTSRLYVLGLAFFFVGYSSLWYMVAMSALLVAVGWAYHLICKLYPDGGGVYSSAKHTSQLLAVIGALLLCANYIITAAISALDAFHYLDLPQPQIWAAGGIIAIAAFNYFGPTKVGLAALVITLLTVLFSVTISGAAIPSLGAARIDAPSGNPFVMWVHFTGIILAISGVEAIANMTGIMVKPVARTAGKAIVPVLIEIVVLNLVLTVAMLAMPEGVLGDGSQHKETMMRVMASYYVGDTFAAIASVVFALLLLSAVNTCLIDLVSIQYMMAADKEMPPGFRKLNKWGMPFIPLMAAAVAPAITVILVNDIARLADLYAIGVVGAVTINLGSTCITRGVPINLAPRIFLTILAVFMAAVWVTIAVEKPNALIFALSVVGIGLVGRTVAHNRAKIRAWFGKSTPAVAEPESSGTGSAKLLFAPPKTEADRDKVKPRLLVSTRGSRKLLNFALEQAKLRGAELLVLYVQHVALPTMGASRPDPFGGKETKALFDEAKKQGEEFGVTVYGLSCIAWDIADAILEMAVTYGADTVILGATQRGGLWRTMKGDVIQQVAAYLPEEIRLVINA